MMALLHLGAVSRATRPKANQWDTIVEYALNTHLTKT